MFPHQRSIRQKTLLLFIILLIFILTFILSKPSKYCQCSSCPILSTLTSTYTILKTTEDKQTSVDYMSIYCLEMKSRLDQEQYLPKSPILYAPSFDSIGLNRLPYRYSQWKSSPILSRRISSCEHTLIMHLLTIIEGICRKHGITFMMAYGTLLGSWRHHDIIPWDDDIDLLIPKEQEYRFVDALNQIDQTLVGYFFHNHKNATSHFYKIFFKHTPPAAELPWNFPFVDIFFYVTNKTHLWQLGYPSDSATKLKYYFPLVLRPFGELWLPAPLKPQRLFEFDPFDECKGHYWDHRTESAREIISLQCDDLKHIYPFVRRYNKQGKSTEILRTNDTIIHTIIYE